MKSDRQGLFTELDPPPGGAERFAQRLEESRLGPPVARRWALASAGVAAATVAIVVVILIREAGDAGSSAVGDAAQVANLYEAPQFDRLLGRPAPAGTVTVTHNDTPATVTQIETANAKIRLYQID